MKALSQSIRRAPPPADARPLHSYARLIELEHILQRLDLRMVPTVRHPVTPLHARFSILRNLHQEFAPVQPHVPSAQRIPSPQPLEPLHRRLEVHAQQRPVDVLRRSAAQAQRIPHLQALVQFLRRLGEDRVGEVGRAVQLLDVAADQRMRATAHDLDLQIGRQRRRRQLFDEVAQVFLAVAAEEVADEEDQRAPLLFRLIVAPLVP